MKVAEIITAKIIAMLEAGVIPWVKGWSTNGLFPTSLVSGKAYRGINIFLLGMQDFGAPYWLTYKQCKAKGGQVRKGEKGTQIIFWKALESKTQTDRNGNPKKSMMMRYYNVFNVEQCDGIEYPKPELKTHNPIPVCESVVEEWQDKPEISHGGGRACYSTRADKVNMPELGRFDKPEEYYSVLFHELIHSTGHESRLNRDMAGCFGSSLYAVEELTAEMGAAFLCGHCGIETKTIDNSAAYINNWLGRLKNDPNLVITAASKAQKAMDLMLNVKFSDKPVASESDKPVAQPAAA